MSNKLIATIAWRHTFHGNDCRGIIVAGDFLTEHGAKSFAARLLPAGTKHEIKSDMPASETFYVVATLIGDQADEFAKAMETHELPDRPTCSRCGERHEPGDLAHSIDWAMPYLVQFDALEHPGQTILPGMPR